MIVCEGISLLVGGKSRVPGVMLFIYGVVINDTYIFATVVSVSSLILAHPFSYSRIMHLIIQS